jgi:hypothetical protein
MQKRYSLPDDRLAMESPAVLLRRRWLPLALLAVPPLVGYIWRGFRLADWGWGLVGLLLSGGFAFKFWHGWFSRATEANSETFPRFVRPLHYWFMLGVWFVCYLLAVGSFVFAPAS